MTRLGRQTPESVREELAEYAEREVDRQGPPPLTEQQQRLIRATFSTRPPARRTQRSA